MLIQGYEELITDFWTLKPDGEDILERGMKGHFSVFITQVISVWINGSLLGI